MTPLSPITGNDQTELLATLKITELLAVARRWYGDISYLFTDISQLQLWRCRESGVKFFDPMVCGDARFYDMINSAPGYYPSDKHEYLEAAKYIKPGADVLDVGCGAGEFSSFLPPGAHFTGIELTPGAIARAQAAGRDVRQAFVEDFSVENPSRFDVVTSFQVIEHVRKPMTFVQGMVDSAKMGGTVIIATPNDNSFGGVAINNLLNVPPHHVTQWTPESLIYVMERAGLIGVRVHTEPLQDVHEEWFLQQLILRFFLGSPAGAELPIVCDRFGFRIRNKLSSIIARKMKRALTPGRSGVLGQSMMAVGRKV